MPAFVVEYSETTQDIDTWLFSDH